MPPPQRRSRLMRFFFKPEPPTPPPTPSPPPTTKPPEDPDISRYLVSIQNFRRLVQNHGITEATQSYEASELIRMTIAADIKPHRRYVWKSDIGRALMRTWRR